MKQLLILSGKGGTGKTTVASAFIDLSRSMAYADCDVDAPNLHLMMHHDSQPLRTPYMGMKKSFIDQKRCANCGLCEQHCRFEAIKGDFFGGYTTIPVACEGCGVCAYICPQDAISMREAQAGELFLWQDERVFSTAQLKMGSGTSGLLVSAVKKQLRDGIAETFSALAMPDIAIIDGSPGIGCPVIASMTGVDLVLIVAEPSVSGMSDFLRILKTANQLQVKVAVCVNKWDTLPEMTLEIHRYCDTQGIHFCGVIPYDTEAVRLINRGMSIVSSPCVSGDAVKLVYQSVMSQLVEGVT